MNYGDYIAEYLGAGLLFTLSLLFVGLDATGSLSPLHPEAWQAGASSPWLSVTSLPGAMILLGCILFSYPAGYLLFDLGLRLLLLFGRDKIYEAETAVLKRRPYVDILNRIERDAHAGYASDNSALERDFSLVRLYLYAQQRETFAALSNYWTRLSRMFASLSSSLLASAAAFYVLGVWSRMDERPRLLGPHAFYVSGVLLAVGLIAIFAYRRSLRYEVRNYVALALHHWNTSAEVQKTRHVFAYGSNMLTARLLARAPSASKLTTGVLRAHRLVFNKVGQDGSAKANVQASSRADAEVHGVVFEVSLADLATLDGHERHYERRRLEVLTPAGPGIMADVYMAQVEATSEQVRPFDWYLSLVLAGARAHGLPPAYVAELASTPVIADEDTLRRQANFALTQP